MGASASHLDQLSNLASLEEKSWLDAHCFRVAAGKKNDAKELARAILQGATAHLVENEHSYLSYRDFPREKIGYRWYAMLIILPETRPHNMFKYWLFGILPNGTVDVKAIFSDEFPFSGWSGDLKKSPTLVDADMRSRIERVLHMNNHSICFRNSEHVANYLLKGHWYSAQMAESGKLFQLFKSKLQEDNQLLAHVNGPPADIQTAEYPCLKDERVLRYLQTPPEVQKKDIKNILFMGFPQSGKSKLINTLFNEFVSFSKASSETVTQDVSLNYGVDDEESKYYCLVDTPGVTTISKCNEEIKNLRKVGMVHMLILPFCVNRIQPKQTTVIKHILKTFKALENVEKVVLIATQAPKGRSEELENAILAEFDLTSVSNYVKIIYLDLEEATSTYAIEMIKAQFAILNEQLYPLIKNTGFYPLYRFCEEEEDEAEKVDETDPPQSMFAYFQSQAEDFAAGYNAQQEPQEVLFREDLVPPDIVKITTTDPSATSMEDVAREEEKAEEPVIGEGRFLAPVAVVDASEDDVIGPLHANDTVGDGKADDDKEGEDEEDESYAKNFDWGGDDTN